MMGRKSRSDSESSSSSGSTESDTSSASSSSGSSTGSPVKKSENGDTTSRGREKQSSPPAAYAGKAAKSTDSEKPRANSDREHELRRRLEDRLSHKERDQRGRDHSSRTSNPNRKERSEAAVKRERRSRSPSRSFSPPENKRRRHRSPDRQRARRNLPVDEKEEHSKNRPRRSPLKDEKPVKREAKSSSPEVTKERQRKRHRSRSKEASSRERGRGREQRRSSRSPDRTSRGALKKEERSPDVRKREPRRDDSRERRHRRSPAREENRREKGEAHDDRRERDTRGQRQHDGDNRRGRRQREPSPEQTGPTKWGKDPEPDASENKEDAAAAVEPEKPSFALSGKLTADTNTFNGVVIKYNEPPEARRPKIRWRLYPFKGDEALKPLYLHRQSAYLIGRERRIADFPVDHPSCSKQHAVLQYRSVKYQREDGTNGRRTRPYIIDLGSANGTFLNGTRIDSARYYELHERDVVKFGFSTREYVLLHENSSEDAAPDSEDEQKEELSTLPSGL